MKTINLEEVFKQFQIENGNYRFFPIEIGHINQTYRVSNGQLSYLFQEINTSIFKNPVELMNNIEIVANHLEKVEYAKKILKPIQTHSNQSFFKTNDEKYWRVFPFFENTYSVNIAQNLEQVRSAGEAFGEFMNALTSLNPSKITSTIPDFHNGKLRWKQFEAAIQEDRVGRLKEIEAFISTIKDHQDIFQNINEVLDNNSLPIRITHNDTKINNLLFDKNTHQPVAVIDWDTIMPNTILSDFGDLVRTFASSKDEEETRFGQIKFRKDVFCEICKGYIFRVRNSVVKSELDSLAESGIWMTYMQVLRFITDYLNGDVYYKISYPLQNLNRAKNQFYFLKEMLKNIDEMKVMVNESLS